MKLFRLALICVLILFVSLNLAASLESIGEKENTKGISIPPEHASATTKPKTKKKYCKRKLINGILMRKRSAPLEVDQFYKVQNEDLAPVKGSQQYFINRLLGNGPNFKTNKSTQ